MTRWFRLAIMGIHIAAGVLALPAGTLAAARKGGRLHAPAGTGFVAVRGSPVLFVLGFAPFALMAFWLVRMTQRVSVAPSIAMET